MDNMVAPDHWGHANCHEKKGILLKRGTHLNLHIDKLSLNLLSFI